MSFFDRVARLRGFALYGNFGELASDSLVRKSRTLKALSELNDSTIQIVVGCIYDHSMISAELISYMFDESKYPAGVTVITGADKRTRSAHFEQQYEQAYQAGRTCLRTDGSPNLGLPAARSLQDENTNLAIFVSELSTAGAKAFDQLLGTVSAAITQWRHVCVVVSGDNWVEGLVKRTEVAPVLVQNAKIIDASNVPMPEKDFDPEVDSAAEVYASFCAIMGGDFGDRFGELMADRRLLSVARDWTVIQVDGNAFDRQQMYDNLQLGEPVALSVVELSPESVKEFKLFLREFADALDAGVIATVEVTGEREVIEALRKSEELGSIAGREYVDLDL